MEDMTEEDAIEHYYYNIVGGHFGVQNPLFIQDTLERHNISLYLFT